MIIKGVISNIEDNKAEAYMPEKNNTVTAMLPLARDIDTSSVKVGDKCVIALFDTDVINFADGVIIAIY